MLAVTTGSLMANAYFLKNAHKKLETVYKSMIEQKTINEDNVKEHKLFNRKFSKIRRKQIRTELALEKR